MADEWPTLSLRGANVSLIDCDHRTPPASDVGYPYVAIPQLRNGHIDLSNVRRITREHFVEWTRKARPTANDVVLSRRCNPGETAIVPPQLEFALSQNLVLLRADGTKVYPPFLRWLVRGPDWWEQVGKFLNVGAVFDSLKCADVPNFRLPIPPLNEQRAISSVLGALDDKIELNRRMNETLEATARAIFKSWFVDFDPIRAKAEGREPPGLSPDLAALFPDAFSADGLPAGWSVARIADIARRAAMGPFGSRITKNNFVEKGVPVIRGQNLAKGFLDDDFVFLTDEKSVELQSSIATPGDIVFTHRGTLGQVGQIPKRSHFKRYVVSQSQMLLSVNAAKISRHIVYLFFRSPWGQAELLANTSTTGVPAIARPLTSLKSIQMVLPSMSVSQAFDSILAPIEEKLSANVHECRTLAQIRDLVLPKLMSGEIRVKDAEKAIERVA